MDSAPAARELPAAQGHQGSPDRAREDIDEDDGSETSRGRRPPGRRRGPDASGPADPVRDPPVARPEQTIEAAAVSHAIGCGPPAQLAGPASGAVGLHEPDVRVGDRPDRASARRRPVQRSRPLRRRGRAGRGPPGAVRSGGLAARAGETPAAAPAVAAPEPGASWPDGGRPGAVRLGPGGAAPVAGLGSPTRR